MVWIKRNFLHIIFFLFSFAPFFWQIRNLSYPFIGSGDFSSPVALPTDFFQRFFTYNQHALSGTDASFVTSSLLLYGFFWLCKLSGMSPLISTLFFLSSLFFISQLSMYRYLKNVFENKLGIKQGSRFWSGTGAIFYGFSPYIVGIISPGHILQLFVYSVFPLFILLLDRFLIRTHIGWKEKLMTIGIFFYCAPAFGNIGFFIILYAILFLYAGLIVLLMRLRIWQSLKHFSFFLILGIIVNIWWLFPYLTGLSSTISKSTGGNYLSDQLSFATVKATFFNMFLGRAESQLFTSNLYHWYTDIPMAAVFIFLCVGCVAAGIRYYKKPFFWTIAVIVVIAFFIAKGNREPYPQLFNYLYAHLPGFQIFRRPVSKIYWLFLFCQTTLGIIGLQYLEKKLNQIHLLYKIYWRGIVVSCAAFLVLAMWLTPQLKAFHIPSYYEEANTYLKQDNATRIFLLPGVFGVNPKFNDAVDNYEGTDFLPVIWNIPIVFPDPTNYSPGLPYKTKANELMTQIIGEQPFCKQARQLNISHIMVRTDLGIGYPIEDLPEILIDVLNNHKNIVKKQYFGQGNSGLIIYTIQKDCRSDTILLNDVINKRLTWKRINPAQLTIHISDVKTGDRIQFLENYSPYWIVFGRNPFQPLFSVSHKMVDGYANEWTINTQELPKGVSDVTLTLFYLPQTLFYLGIGIFVISLVSLGFWAYSASKSRKTCRKGV